VPHARRAALDISLLIPRSLYARGVRGS
jgi:hypothetical protein